MKVQREPITFAEDTMIAIHLSGASFEVNEDLIPVIKKTASTFGLSSLQELTKVSEEDFFSVFTPLMNAHYNLK